MRRKSFDALVSFGGLLMVVVLLAAGALLFWGYSYANNSVSSQLSAQKIDFPNQAALATAANPKPGGFSEITPAMLPYLQKYAGQELTTGAQAQAYANHFIAIHLQAVSYTHLDVYKRQLPKCSRSSPSWNVPPRSHGALEPWAAW